MAVVWARGAKILERALVVIRPLAGTRLARQPPAWVEPPESAAAQMNFKAHCPGALLKNLVADAPRPLPASC